VPANEYYPSMTPKVVADIDSQSSDGFEIVGTSGFRFTTLLPPVAVPVPQSAEAMLSQSRVEAAGQAQTATGSPSSSLTSTTTMRARQRNCTAMLQRPYHCDDSDENGVVSDENGDDGDDDDDKMGVDGVDSDETLGKDGRDYEETAGVGVEYVDYEAADAAADMECSSPEYTDSEATGDSIGNSVFRMGTIRKLRKLNTTDIDNAALEEPEIDNAALESLEEQPEEQFVGEGDWESDWDSNYDSDAVRSPRSLSV
jgi:hypothetical protein